MAGGAFRNGNSRQARLSGQRRNQLHRRRRSFHEDIEHKHFEKTESAKTVVSREYPAGWKKGDEPYYPVNDKKNDELYKRYLGLAEKEKNVHFGGRLGTYKYADMDDTVAAALEFTDAIPAK